MIYVQLVMGWFVQFRCAARKVETFSFNGLLFEWQKAAYGMSLYDCLDSGDSEWTWKPDWALASTRAHDLLARVETTIDEYRKKKDLEVVRQFVAAVDHCAAPSRQAYCWVMMG